MGVAIQEKMPQTLITRLFDEVWNQGKLDVLDELFVPTIILHLSDQTINGCEAWKQVIAHWRHAFPDIHYEILDIIHTEETVICRWAGRGTQLGTFNGKLPTKQKMTFDGITIFKLNQEKCTEVWVVANTQKLNDDLALKSTHAYTLQDFSVDPSGPAAKVYEWVMKARTVPSCKQRLADTLRDQFHYMPADNQPLLTVPKELFEQVSVKEHFIISKDKAQIRSLIYTPKRPSTSMPILLYLHGGGWTMGSPESTDLVTRKLAYLSGCLIISVDYRLAPENPYPVGLDDCMAMYQWTLKNASQLHGNAEKIAIGGDSCGGNLALALALRARDEGIKLPNALLALCPLTDFAFEKYPSVLKLGPNSLLYDFAFLSCVRTFYSSYDQWQHPYVSPMYGHLQGLCPTFILSAGQDPLIDDNKEFTQKLKKAGVTVEFMIHEEMPHAYYYFLGLTKEEEEAYKGMARFLQKFAS